jgi:hypothetical protein
MTIDEKLSHAVRGVVELLVNADIGGLANQCVLSRLTKEDVRSVVNEYGRKLVLPPSDAYRELDAVRVSSTDIPRWSVRMPLWTKEEGRSDLTLELTVTMGANDTQIDWMTSTCFELRAG